MRPTTTQAIRLSVVIAVLGASVAVAALAAAPGPVAGKPSEFTFHQEGVLGTSLDLTVVCRDQAQADAALATVLISISGNRPHAAGGASRLRRHACARSRRTGCPHTVKIGFRTRAVKPSRADAAVQPPRRRHGK